MTVEDFGQEKVADFPEQQELYDRLLVLVYEYEDDMSLAAMIGVLELVKDTFINSVRED